MTNQEKLNSLLAERSKLAREYQALGVILKDTILQIHELQKKMAGFVYPGEVYVNPENNFEYVVARIHGEIVLTSTRTGKVITRTPCIRDDDDRPGAYRVDVLNDSIKRLEKKPC